MTKKRETSAIWNALGGLGWPLILGLGACSGFYLALFGGPLDWPITRRYFTGHPVPYAEAALFFIGLAALVLKLGDIVLQSRTHSDCPLDPLREGEARGASDASGLLAQLAAAPQRFRDSHLGQRLRDALLHVQRQGSAAALDEELKYLADRSLERQHDSLALPRIVIWAIPMLGFLGTVMGIAKALGNLDPTQLATDPAKAMEGLLAGLYIAFDTTALALTLSIGLMFTQFLVERVEGEMLATVEQQTLAILNGRFETGEVSRDPNVATVERMCYTVMRAAESLVARQTELWREVFEATSTQWQQQISSTGATLQKAITASLDESLARHAERLSEWNGAATEKFDERWRQWNETLEQCSHALLAQQQALQRQGEIMSEAMRATGDVIQLERALNENLTTLAGARNFEETLLTLTAAVHMLSARAGGASESRRVEITSASTSSERAA